MTIIKSRRLSTQEILDKFRRMDLSKIEIDYLRNEIEPLFERYTHTGVLWLPAIGKFHRARKYDSLPTKKSDLIYPPLDKPHKIKLGRANLPSKPLFYCSGDPRAAFFELRAQPGETVVLSKWTLKEQALLFLIGYSPESFIKLNAVRCCPTIPQMARKIHKSSHSNTQIEKFFEEIFTRVINVGEEHFYKLTAVIAECFLNIDPQCGIAYSTIAMQANAENFALTPSLVDQKLNFETTACFKIESVNGLEYQVRKILFADRINPAAVINAFHNAQARPRTQVFGSRCKAY